MHLAHALMHDYMINNESTHAAQALDVALKHNTSMNPKCQAFARAFFWQDPDKIRPLGGGAEVRCKAFHTCLTASATHSVYASGSA